MELQLEPLNHALDGIVSNVSYNPFWKRVRLGLVQFPTVHVFCGWWCLGSGDVLTHKDFDYTCIESYNKEASDAAIFDAELGITLFTIPFDLE